MAAATDLLSPERFGYLKPKDVARLAEAYRFSEAAHAGQTRQSGDPYISHPLAVADKQRSPLAPNVPTLAELGVKDVEVTAWQGLMAPKGLSPEIQKMPDVAAKMKVFGALPAGGEPARLAKVNADDNARFGQIIKELGIQAD